MRDISETKEYNTDDTINFNPVISEKLRNYLPLNFDLSLPENVPFTVEREWIGIMGFTPDHQPLIGPLANREGEYIIAGYSGHGMPVAFLAGQHISEMILGIFDEQNPIDSPASIVLKNVYNPSRFGL